jgi:hypothetical protein
MSNHQVDVPVREGDRGSCAIETLSHDFSTVALGISDTGTQRPRLHGAIATLQRVTVVYSRTADCSAAFEREQFEKSVDISPARFPCEIQLVSTIAGYGMLPEALGALWATFQVAYHLRILRSKSDFGWGAQC